MPKTAYLQFAQRYHTALRHHLRAPPLQRSTAHAGLMLGRAAATLGMNARDLTRIHDQAVASLSSVRMNYSGPNGGHFLSPPAVFLVETLTPIAQRERAAAAGTGRAERLGAALRVRAAALTEVRRRLRQEITLRKLSDRKREQREQHYHHLLAQSAHLREQSRELAHQVLSAQEEERKEISRELHDEVAQILAGINVQLAALKEAAAINTRSLRQRIGQTQRLVERSVQIVHRYARELRPALLDDLGLIPALRSYIRDLPGRRGLPIRLKACAGVEALDNSRRTVLYRVAQEALTNVARHAHARLATVHISKTPNGVRLEVRDDGRSFQIARTLTSNTRKRLGLLGMRERVEMVGGKFSIESSLGKGTVVRADIPLHSPAAATLS